MMPCAFRRLAIGLGLLGAAVTVSATSIVPPANLGELARTSDAVVVAVAGRSDSVHRGSMIVTRTPFQVAENVAGTPTRGISVTVEVPGGEVDGTGWAVAGAPRFAAGETYMLFLKRRPDGTWQPAVMAWGLLHQIEGRDGSTLLAPVAEMADVQPFVRDDGVLPETVGVYRRSALVSHLRDVVRNGAPWTSDRVLAPQTAVPLDVGLLTAPSACSFMTGNDGSGIRWNFDGTTADMWADAAGDDSYGGQGAAFVSDAVSRWTGISATDIAARYRGTTTPSMSCSDDPRDIPTNNVVVFNDPCDDIADLSSCGGTLAYGGPYYGAKHTFDGQQWYTAGAWFVVVNNGIGACLSTESFTRMLTHELGHGLGFGHVTDSSALMYGTCCNNINSTDTTCAQYLYPAAGATPTPTPTPTIPLPPSSVSASDGTYTDRVRVTWTASDGATSYQVWRATADASGTASVIGTATGTAGYDYGAVPGTTYWYWVKAVNSAGTSGFSPSDSGYRAVAATPTPTPTPTAPPAAPASLSASDGTYADRVAVTWTASDGASSYQVWRSTTSSSATASLLGTTAATAFADTTATLNATYWYWAKAVNSYGTSGFSPGDSGYRSTSPTPTPTPTPGVPAAPASLSASDGAFTDRILILWSASAGATRYELFRSGSADPASAVAIASLTATSFEDRTTAAGVPTWYWVRAWNSIGPSALSPGDSGYRASSATPTPTPSPTPTPTITAAFTYSPALPAVDQTVAFTDTSIGATSYTWTFGDGATSTARFPTHVYRNAGAYTVTQQVSGPAGTDSTSRTITVVVAVEPATVAVVAHLQGYGSSQWRTDVAVSNPSDHDLPLQLEYTRSGTTTPTTRTLDLGPRETRLLPDILKTFFQVGDGRGSLRVIPPVSGPSPAVASRTYAAEPDGNLGQGLPALPLQPAGVTTIPGLFADNAYRSNVAITAGDRDVTAVMNIYRGSDGRIGGTVRRDVTAGSQEQWALSDLFPGVAVAGVPMSVQVSTDEPAIVYASLADQSSQDSVFLMANTPAEDWLVPVVAHNSGLQGTFWRSDVAVLNRNAGPAVLTLEYLPEGQDNSGGGSVASFTVPPYGTAMLADVTATLFDVTSGKGSLHVSSTQPVSLSSRTYTNRTDGSTYGHGSPPLAPAALSAAPRTLPGVRHGNGYRTNIGLATGTTGANVALVLRDADGHTIAERSLWVPPRSLVQKTLPTAFPGAVPPAEVGSIEVSPDAPVAAYLAVVDESSQDPILFLLP